MTTASVPGFAPSRHALRFTNAFPPAPAVTLDLGPAGVLGIGDASNGLCGGMVLAVRDLFEAWLTPPEADQPPAAGSPLFRYLVRRLIDSWDVPGGVLRYLRWMLTPDGDAGVGPFAVHGVAHMTILEQLPHVRAEIDEGRLCPLGLVTQHSADVGRLGRNHQVLAYGYALDGDLLTLSVYDPNTSLAGADDVRITLSVAGPHRATPVRHNVNLPEPVRGFFISRYRPPGSGALAGGLGG